MVFIANGALNPDQYSHILVSRQIIDDILSHITEQPQYITLNGSKCSGKTTILYQIINLLKKKRYGVVYLYLGDLHGIEPNNFYQKICKDIQEQFAADNLNQLIDINRNPEKIKNQSGFYNHLKLLARHIEEANLNKLVFILDEINDVPQEIASSFFPTLKTLYQLGQNPFNNYNCHKVIFVISASFDFKLIEEQYSIQSISKTFKLDDFSYQQVLELANNFNRQEFPSPRAQKIAKYVYQWCSGHPYLTQDLYSLIEESTDCKNCNDDQIPEIIEKLVHDRLISTNNDNANITYLLKYLKSSAPSVHDAIRKILYNQPQRILIENRELLAFGILRFSEDHNLVIRNKIYEQVLKSFFCDSS